MTHLSNHQDTQDGQSRLSEFGSQSGGQATPSLAESSEDTSQANQITNPKLGPATETGIADLDLAVQVGGIHVIGVLHSTPNAIARLTGAITRYEPDIVAVEASKEAVVQHHPDYNDPRWPPAHEFEAAAFATRQLEWLLIAGIDTVDWTMNVDFAELDAEILTTLGLITEPADLSTDTYYDLDLPTIREWRQETRRREPEAFEEILSRREDVMAGHLHELYQYDSVDTIVAAVGIQHLTGVLDRLQDPTLVPPDKFDLPPVSGYLNYKEDGTNLV